MICLLIVETNIRDAAYIPVHADQDYVLSVDLERLNKVFIFQNNINIKSKI